VYLETFYTVYVCGLWCLDVAPFIEFVKVLINRTEHNVYSTEIDLLEGA